MASQISLKILGKELPRSQRHLYGAKCIRAVRDEEYVAHCAKNCAVAGRRGNILHEAAQEHEGAVEG